MFAPSSRGVYSVLGCLSNGCIHANSRAASPLAKVSLSNEVIKRYQLPLPELLLPKSSHGRLSEVERVKRGYN